MADGEQDIVLPYANQVQYPFGQVKWTYTELIYEGQILSERLGIPLTEADRITQRLSQFVNQPLVRYLNCDLDDVLQENVIFVLSFIPDAEELNLMELYVPASEPFAEIDFKVV